MAREVVLSRPFRLLHGSDLRLVARSGSKLEQFFPVFRIPNANFAIMAPAGDAFAVRVIGNGIDPVVVGSVLLDQDTIRQFVLSGDLVGAPTQHQSVGRDHDSKDFPVNDNFTCLLRVGNVPESNLLVASAGGHRVAIG